MHQLYAECLVVENRIFLKCVNALPDINGPVRWGLYCTNIDCTCGCKTPKVKIIRVVIVKLEKFKC